MCVFLESLIIALSSFLRFLSLYSLLSLFLDLSSDNFLSQDGKRIPLCTLLACFDSRTCFGSAKGFGTCQKRYFLSLCRTLSQISKVI